jgi:hypothetical protein
MYTLELTTSQLLMLKEMIDNDIEMSCMDAPDYTDMDAMHYYMDRCTVFHLVKEELET